MTKKTESSSRLFEIFTGEFVNMLTKMSMERTVNNGEMSETIKTPMAVQGFLVEVDDEYYYLGISPGLINQSVKIDEVVHVELAQEESELMEELLLSGEIPPESEFN